MSRPALHLMEGYPLKYLIRAPGSAVEESPPLLCFLHGYDEGGPTDIFDALTRHGPLRSTDPSAYKDPFVIVAPQLPVRGDTWNRHAEPVRQIVVDVAKRHGCDPRRLYLTGFSFGGNGVFDLSFGQAAMWAALWPVDPTRVPATPPTTPVWLSLGEISRFQAPSFIRTLRLESAETAAPAADRVWSDAGEDHVGTATQAYKDERVYRWLLTKQLQ